jgi:hypothetical protein
VAPVVVDTRAGGADRRRRSEGRRLERPGVVGVFDKGASDAREKDFKDNAFGGIDTTWVDAVDLAFYKGHANGNGWQFDTQQDDTQLHYTEGKWGNRDLEWLVIEACGPLRPLSDGKDVIERWGPTFAGLHSLLGYATVSRVCSRARASGSRTWSWARAARTRRRSWTRGR